MINFKKQIFKNESSFLLIFLALYLSVLLGFYFNEDNLGGAINDATYHFKISQKFNQNFNETIINFGGEGLGMSNRNSPVFWIFLSFLDKILSYNEIRFLNTIVIFLTAFIFNKCLKLKFRNIDHISLLVITSFIFLSPSLRSLAIWPYSLAWGLFFFTLSIYYYLKFQDNLDFKRSIIILSLLIFSSYIYPSFSVFSVFYLYKIFKNNKKLIINLLFFSFLMSLPCLAYLISKDVFNSFQNAQGVDIPLSQSLNISNKFLIISTIFLYFIAPIINFKEIMIKL